IQVPDIQAAVGEYPEGSAFARALNFRTVLSVPLLHTDGALGTITIRRAEVRPFTDQQVRLLETFADQAVIAIENVRLFTELEARNRDLTATSEILRVISSSPTDLQPVMEAVAESAARLCETEDVLIYRKDGDRVRLVAHHGTIGTDPVGEVFALVPG